MSQAKEIRILLVDDHKIIRDGVQAMLSQSPDFTIVGSVGSGEEAINAVRENPPDIIVMDIIMGGMTGIEATRWIKEFNPTIKVLILSMEMSKDYISAAINSGAESYLPKDVSGDQLIEALRTIYNGSRFFNEAIMKLVFEDFYVHEKLKAPGKRLPNDLTKREHEVLGLVALGKSNKIIADSLFISVKTVETHKTHILDKLGLKNTAELVRYAIKNNIISVDAI
jgi:DNA-binding NarL/FixJ family response regulator